MWKWSNNNNKAKTPTTLPLNKSQKRKAGQPNTSAKWNSWIFGTSATKISFRSISMMLLLLLVDFTTAYKNFRTHVSFHYERSHAKRTPCTWSKKIESLFTLRLTHIESESKGTLIRRANACASFAIRFSALPHLISVEFQCVCASVSTEHTQSVCRLVQLQNRKPTEKINRVQEKKVIFWNEWVECKENENY